MKKIVSGIFILLAICCKQRYEPNISSPDTGYLVVDGYISAAGPAEIHLSRTLRLRDSVTYKGEIQAQVILQGNDNSSYPLTEDTPGVYTYNTQTLNNNQLYRLFIKTKEGKQYLSDYVKVKHAPEIDTIDWAFERGGLQLYVNTHDPKNDTWYYRWETDETWEFLSKYQTQLKWVRDAEGQIQDVTYRFPNKAFDTAIYRCWQNEQLSNLLIGSSAKLNQDVMHFPIVHIPNNSWKLSDLYSIKITQYALTKEAYQYLEKIKNNSETTGSIFDRQPSELAGNIHCLTLPEEPVLGFLTIADRKQKRFWIKNSAIPYWNYSMDCNYFVLIISEAKLYNAALPLYYSPPPYTIAIADAACVDCTLRGTNVKPSFWP
jgi:hypothetical protein